MGKFKRFLVVRNEDGNGNCFVEIGEDFPVYEVGKALSEKGIWWTVIRRKERSIGHVVRDYS